MIDCCLDCPYRIEGYCSLMNDYDEADDPGRIEDMYGPIPEWCPLADELFEEPREE